MIISSKTYIIYFQTWYSLLNILAVFLILNSYLKLSSFFFFFGLMRIRFYRKVDTSCAYSSIKILKICVHENIIFSYSYWSWYFDGNRKIAAHCPLISNLFFTVVGSDAKRSQKCNRLSYYQHLIWIIDNSDFPAHTYGFVRNSYNLVKKLLVKNQKLISPDT